MAKHPARGAPPPGPVFPRPPLARLACALAVYKVLVFLLIYAAMHVLSGIFNASNYYGNFHWPSDAAPSMASVFKTWDAQLYLYLSERGYEAGLPTGNFYPLWPLLIRLGSYVFRDSLISGLVLSNLLSLAGVVFFYAATAERIGERAAETAVLLLLAFPGALFLSFPFSESLFLLLAAALFLSFSRRRVGAAAAIAFLLPLARPQGVFVAPFYWLALRRLRREAGGGWRAQDWAAALAPVAGFAAYLLVMRLALGDPLAGFAAYRQHYAHPPTLAQLVDLPAFAAKFFRATAVHEYYGSFVDRLWFVLFAASLVPLWRRDRLGFAYALPLGLVPALASTFTGYTRHCVLLLPVFALGGALLSDERRRWALWATLAALLSLQTLFLVLHINNYWVG